jgi:hypothetical protein
MLEQPSADIQATVELAVTLLSFAVCHVHGRELERNVTLGSEPPFTIIMRSPAQGDTQKRQRFAETWKLLARTTPNHKYDFPIRSRPAAVAAVPCHLNDIATYIHARVQTLLT